MKTLIIAFWDGVTSLTDDSLLEQPLPSFTLALDLTRKIALEPLLLLPFPDVVWTEEEKKLDLYKLERIERNLGIFEDDPNSAIALLLIDRGLKEKLLSRLNYYQVVKEDDKSIGVIEKGASEKFLMVVEDLNEAAPAVKRRKHVFGFTAEDPDQLSISEAPDEAEVAAAEVAEGDVSANEPKTSEGDTEGETTLFLN